MATTLDNLIPVAEAARRAHWGRVKFKAFAERAGLLIEDGGGEKRKLYVVNWPEVQKAILDRPRHTPAASPCQSDRRPVRRSRATATSHPDVTC